ncbi:MAG TPA: cytochrome C biosynthesis protein [Sphingobium sp.]|uniref:tetratricopeptide repeat protein n=1 Tax=unclassified Sphingobium TaxID=2611147 RepID=UPI000ECA6F23|nr:MULTISPECIES: tetratricopeptide repeat protein [unclassified Sphingobium]WIW89804.1 tetratricopeptide repeat protein [Sphingobium sp. V4]HAF40522.1 cytochrome C biosynthesis protein [Sphingobium sp.]
MTGWFIAFGLAALAFVALLLIGRIPRSVREISAAALLLGLAGYAWQGHPGQAGAPRRHADTKGEAFDEEQAEKRRGLAERFGPAAQWMMLSDGLARQGKTKEAANVLLSGLRDTPDDANLWLGLGNALVNHADGVISPGAEFAYRRALALDPEGPAPRYFYGLALARAGQLQAARDLWAPLAASAPADSQVKAELQANIARIDAMLAQATSVPQ